MQKTPIKLVCSDCGHASVCKIAPNVESMLASLFPENGRVKPVCKPEDFANICNAFVPKSMLSMPPEDSEDNNPCLSCGDHTQCKGCKDYSHFTPLKRAEAPTV